jgi:hypothetical protein
VLLQITAPAPKPFCAGLVLDDSYTVVDAAPILKWTKGKYVNDILHYCQRKGWTVVQAGD